MMILVSTVSVMTILKYIDTKHDVKDTRGNIFQLFNLFHIGLDDLNESL